jgi:hypothetical protein
MISYVDDNTMYEFDFVVESIFAQLEEGLSFDEMDSIVQAKVRERLPHFSETLIEKIDRYYLDWLDIKYSNITIQ